MTLRLVAGYVGCLAAAFAGCGCRTRVDRCSDPAAVARAFIQAMESSDREGALALLSRADRDRFDERAKRASATLGQIVRPADLLVPERSLLARPEWLAIRSRGEVEAYVEVRPPLDAGAEGEGPWGVQRLVREDGCWRIDLFAPLEPGESEQRRPLH